MTKSYVKDIQLLLTIGKNQTKIEAAIKQFGCSQNDLEKNEMAFDLCAFYMAQIGEVVKLLTDDTKDSLNFINADIMRMFRNMVDHTYEKVNKAYLKAYIFQIISQEAKKEIKERVLYCTEQSKKK